MDILWEPFGYSFFVNAMVVTAVAGGLCGLIGVFVFLRGMAYIGHGLSHAIFGWAVVSFTGNVNFYLGAGAGGFLSALLINFVTRRRVIGADAAIGVVTTGLFALGLAVVSRQRSFTRNFEAALFGNVLGVTSIDVAVVAGIGALIAAAIFFNFRGLLWSTFDPEVADISGVSTARYDVLLSLLLAGTIVVTLQVLGVTLVAAALITPPAAARLITDRFGTMVRTSVAIGIASGVLGVWLSYFLDISSGSAVVLTSTSIFAIAFALTAFKRRPATGIMSR